MEENNIKKSDFSILVHFIKITNKVSKTYIPFLVLASIFKAVVPFINIIMPKFIIDELMGSQRVEKFVVLILITIVGNAILSIINKWFDKSTAIRNEEILAGFDLLIGKKIMDMDFEKIEDPEILNLKERALFPIHNQLALTRMISGIMNILTQILTIIGLIGVIVTLNVFIIIAITLIVILNMLIYKKSQNLQYKFNNKLIPINRYFMYYLQTTTDFSLGKDIRLYSIASLIIDKIKKFNKNSIDIFGKMFKRLSIYDGINQVNLQIQMVVVYGYIAYKLLVNSISIGDFTLYTNAAINFSNSISEIFNNYVELRQMCRYLEAYIEFESIEVSNKTGMKKLDKNKEYNIEFKNVWFKYPRAKDYTLSEVSIKINNGEKLSVVGLNGAGKTTFIKLLTRLYSPTKGEILLNGVNINEIDYKEYMKILSIVFQDFKLMAFSIKENITIDKLNEIEDKEIIEVLKKTGFDKDLKKLDKGINTFLYKIFEKDGVELSGGQSQKLAIARAIYKNAPIVVLDEPTAALDPHSEYEIYSKFNELIGGKTTIYISHRLSSCKFCDKIAVFNKGKIVQYGSNEELIKNKGSEYEVMYSAQAQYYI
ncbi:ABC transporter ATP-binding protein [Clostridium carnis]